MTLPTIEDQIRAALQTRADKAPASGTHAKATLTERRRPLRRFVAAGIAAASMATLSVVITRDDGGEQVVADGGETGEATTPANPGGDLRQLPNARFPRLGFDSPGFRFLRVEECQGSPATTTVVVHDGERRRPTFQSFGHSYAQSPLLFIQTLTPVERENFGLVDAEKGDAFEARGVTGYAAYGRGQGHGWNLGVELPDGRAMYAIVLGLELPDVIGILDGLTPRPDGSWQPGALPHSMTELERSRVADDCGYYTAVGDLPDDAVGGFELNLYNDAFDQRLADRAASTIGAIVATEIGGIPAAVGSYQVDDHWAMFEPAPGRTMEIRASSMTKGDLLEILSHARFVDESTWQNMRP